MENELVEINSIVSSLNDDFFVDDGYVLQPCSFVSNSSSIRINFMGIKLWSTDTEERKFIEELNDYESLTPFLKREANKIKDVLVKCLRVDDV